MSYARQLLETTPRTLEVDAAVLAAAIDTLSDCAQVCTADAAADLSESNVAEMVQCIRLCQDCTDICVVTAAIMSRQTDHEAAIIKHLLEACVAICRSCGDECQLHAQMHEHCRICAEACRRCEQDCQTLLEAMK